MAPIPLTTEKSEKSYDVIVVGGGFSGLYQLYYFRKAGYKVHLFEAGNGLGGVWYWNSYPGARVDTEIPVYQFIDPGIFKDWKWKERYPGRDEITAYFKHVEKVWDLNPDISYESRVTAMKWDEQDNEWLVNVTGLAGDANFRSSFVVLCTGFASAPYIPRIRGLDDFQGRKIHTSDWPKETEHQQPLDLTGKRVGVIGTGATGVQVIQEVAHVAGHLTVFQRTPNMALPMGQKKIDEARNKELKESYPDMTKKMRSSFAGFLYDFSTENSSDKTEEERRAFYEELFQTGGLHFWLGTYKDVLFNKEANDDAYKYWREKTLKRIKSQRVAEILAPKKAPHPFGTKRVSLEQNYFECFDQDNVTLVDLTTNDIASATATGLKTADGENHELDILVLATGFDSISGGITQIDIRGLNNQSVKEKWSTGIDTQLGMTTSGFPNFFFVYGPQAPTAFATGPCSAEAQGDWIMECMAYMKKNGLKTVNPTVEAEVEWTKHVDDLGSKGLFPEAKSWYFGDNIPGKKRQALNYMAGMPIYKEKVWASAKNGYEGFVMA
jgi:cation diffusion facilitator CzcD-associated flavoprotein CzcO